MKRSSPALLLCVLLAVGAPFAPGTESRKRTAVDESELPEPVKRPVKYFGDVHPVLMEHCVSCHGPDKQKGGLRLDSREMALAGGSSYGPAILPGKSAQSPLILFIAHLEPEMEMPPKKDILPEQTLAVLRAWIDQGADWPTPPGGAAHAIKTLGNQELFFKKAATHWAFQPVRKADAASLSAGPATIDSLINARLQTKGLARSPRADARTLLRRLHFDTTGLPPSPDELASFRTAFEHDAPAALTSKVDELLASPHFGERWGRYWLDIARYADTQDFFPTQDLRYPFAWTYRDYVTDAFNSGKPHDQFLREQIAADQLGLPDNDPALAALGFLTVGPRFLRRLEEQINDRIDVLTRGLMGMTVVCARCHDHKYDPIPTADFYALHGVLSSTEDLTTLPEIHATSAVPTTAQRADYEAAMAKARQAITDLTNSLREKAVAAITAKPEAYFDALAQVELLKKDQRKVVSDTKLSEAVLSPLSAQWNALRKSSAAADDPVLGPLAIIAAAAEDKRSGLLESISSTGLLAENKPAVHPLVLAAIREQKPTNAQALLLLYGKLLANAAADNAGDSREILTAFTKDPGLLALQPKDVEAAGRASTENRREYDKLDKALAEVEATHPGSPPRAMAVRDRAKPVKPVIYMRGDPAKKGDPVDRRFLQVLDPAKKPFSAEHSGRRELAEKIASPDNPLTPRVWANHVWRHLLGLPLVKTTGDFGLQSAPPTHPELLDWLASALVQRNWSTKQLVRDILLSETYQQDSTQRTAPAAADPDNQLLWRAHRRRMDFESMRDAMLATSGKLDPKVGGRAVNLSSTPFTSRRTLYGFVDRVNIDPLFTTFDFPSPDISSTERAQTLVPQQALFALNDAFIIEQARTLAKGALDSAAPRADSATALDWLYLKLFQRHPTAPESRMATAFLQETDSLRQDTTPHGTWLYGVGSADPETPRTEAFQPLPHFDAQTKRYQGGRVFPDSQLGFASLSAGGGHPDKGIQKAVLRRWIAPCSGDFTINGELSVNAAGKGDGVRARVISSRSGLCGEWIVDRVENTSLKTRVAALHAEAGDILDFAVDCRETTQSDGFRWSPTIRLQMPAGASTPADKPMTGAPSSWDAQSEFKAPQPTKLLPLEQLAQALLITNEFLFID